MAKVVRKLWGGIIEFEDDDAPFEIRSFNSIGKSPRAWFMVSRSLHHSAIRLMASLSENEADVAARMYRPVALMLGAYAVETLLKMVIADKYCRENGLKFDALTTKDFLPTIHDLVALASRAAPVSIMPIGLPWLR